MELVVFIALAIAVFLGWFLRPKAHFDARRPGFYKALPYRKRDELLTRPEALPYRKRDYLLTRAERSFFEILIRAVPSGLHVFAKVRLADLVWIPRGQPRHRAHLYKVLPKHIDFVLCDRARIAPLVAIELDDSSHRQPDRIERDEFVNEALRAAGLPLVRVPVKHSYSLKEIEQFISDALRRPAATTLEKQSVTPTPQSAPVVPSIVVEDVSRHIDPIGKSRSH